MNSKLKLISSKVISLMCEYDIPGVSLGIITPDETHIETFGYTNKKKTKKILEEGFWKVQSISKNISATASVYYLNMLNCHSDQDYNFDTKLNSNDHYVVFSQELVTKNISIKDCFSHSIKFSESSGQGGNVAAVYGYDKDFVYDSFQHYQIDSFRSLFDYNNITFSLGFNFISKLHSKSELELLSDFFMKNKMKDTTVEYNKIITNPNLILPTQNGMENPISNSNNFPSPGGVATTIFDLLTYLNIHLSPKQNWQQKIKEIYIPVIKSQFPNGKYYGIGTAIDYLNDNPVYYHPGASIMGYSHVIFYDIINHIGIVILTNSFNPIPVALAYYVYLILMNKPKQAKLKLKEILEMSSKAVDNVNDKKYIEMSGSIKNDFSGKYFNKQNGDLKITNNFIKFGNLNFVPYKIRGNDIVCTITDKNFTERKCIITFTSDNSKVITANVNTDGIYTMYIKTN